MPWGSRYPGNNIQINQCFQKYKSFISSYLYLPLPLSQKWSKKENVLGALFKHYVLFSVQVGNFDENIYLNKEGVDRSHTHTCAAHRHVSQMTLLVVEARDMSFLMLRILWVHNRCASPFVREYSICIKYEKNKISSRGTVNIAKELRVREEVLEENRFLRLSTFIVPVLGQASLLSMNNY